MRFEKIIPVFLMLVLLLQLLPVKQAVQYFCVDNILIEEIQHNGFSKNFKPGSDDHNLPEAVIFSHHLIAATCISLLHFVEHLPSIHAKDIHTPPPNGLAI